MDVYPFIGLYWQYLARRNTLKVLLVELKYKKTLEVRKRKGNQQRGQ